ncbi:hypothetical protein EMPS_10934 [Entomortierella parvispora]|uniref:Protein kinase domain-containing protein n=1 Tax=Entomortierella parvispora TaxID=205924 RepID=A0A9P3HL42_9FUNG|nr:hypothetical protein EMPS_10934 [Entomortierella parvispora]
MGNVLTKLCSDDLGDQKSDENHAPSQDANNHHKSDNNDPDQGFLTSPDQPSLKPSSDYKTPAPQPQSDLVILDTTSVPENNQTPSTTAVPSSSTPTASASAAPAAAEATKVSRETPTKVVSAIRALSVYWSRSNKKSKSSTIAGSTGPLTTLNGDNTPSQESNANANAAAAAATSVQPVSLAQGLKEFSDELSPDDQRLLLANEIPATEIEKLTIGVDAGGMGIIHVAEWKGVKVAIKEALAHVISKEVEIYTRMLGYEGVVQFYGVTYPPGLNKLCIVTKYAENGSLSWHLKVNFSKLSWSDKLSLATQMVAAVAQLHEKGIFHRDLHGGNILIDEACNAMLTDFGASTMEERVGWAVSEFAISTIPTPEGGSKFVSELIPSMRKELLDYEEKQKESGAKEGEAKDEEATNSSLSTSRNQSSTLGSTLASSAPESWSNSKAAVDAWGNRKEPKNSKAAVDAWGNTKTDGQDHEESLQDALIGVMAYIAPERFRNPRHFDARCDIYSLGVLLWELTSGHAAFVKSPQDVQLAVSILNGKREEAIEGTPEKYQILYERCWDPVPDRRPSLAEVLSTLAEVKAELSEEQLAVTRERISPRDHDEGSDFEESLSVPRPTSDYQKYLLPEDEE